MATATRGAMPTRDRAGGRPGAMIRARRDGARAARATRATRAGEGRAVRAGRARAGAMGAVGGTAARGTGRAETRGLARARGAASAGSSYWSEEETTRETETIVETRTGGVKATMTFAVTEDDEDDGSGAGKRALGLAAFAAFVAAFAYSDVSASFPFLAPAQTLARALVDMVAAGVDYFVDITLDAYDAAILGCINVFSWFQSFLLTPGGVIENGAKASSAVMADPSTFVSKAVGLLCAKPFMSIAAVLLTLSRVVASWTFAAAEYACALLYAMPVYVATPTAVLAYLYFKKQSIKKVETEKAKSTRKMAKAKAKAATIVSTGSATGASAKWAERLAAGTTSVESFKASATRSSDVTIIDSVIDSSSDFSYSGSSSYANDASSAPIVATPVNYDSYSSSSSSASASLSGFTGMYDFEESYSNREALMGGYNIDQAEVERLYAELMPKDAGIPLPTVTVAEKVVETAETKFLEQASSVAKATKEEVKSTPSAAATKAVETTTETVVKAEVKPTPVTPVKTSSSSSMSTTTTSSTTTTTSTASGTKEVKKGGSKEAFLGFVDKVSSIKPEDVTKVVTETAKVVTSKESLDLAAKLASEAANKVQSSIKSVDEGAESKSTALPGGTRKVSSQDEDLSEGTMIKKKK